MISISGMTCNNCVNKISVEIKKLGYEKFKIDLQKGTLSIEDDGVNWNLIRDTIESIGFKVIN